MLLKVSLKFINTQLLTTCARVDSNYTMFKKYNSYLAGTFGKEKNICRNGLRWFSKSDITETERYIKHILCKITHVMNLQRIQEVSK